VIPLKSYIHQTIEREDGKIAFCFTKRRPFTASIWRSKKVGRKRKRKVWTRVKSKVCRSKKRAIQVAERWFKGYANRKPRQVKVLLT
jgi:hypothetical protein